MNSFSNIQQTTKTFGFNLKQSDNNIQVYNDQHKHQQHALDSKTFEMTTDFTDFNDGAQQIDYGNNVNTQKEIVVQKDKINVMSDPSNIQLANITNKHNPMLRNGDLSNEQRPMRVIEQIENQVVEPGFDYQTQLLQDNVKENIKQAKVQAQKMKQHRQHNQFTPRPVDISLSKRQDPDRAMIEQKINTTQKLINDTCSYYGKQNDNDPLKRQVIVPRIGLQVQQNQISTQQTYGDVIYSTAPKIMRENINTQVPMGTRVVTNINVEKLISMPKYLNSFVQNYIGPQLLQSNDVKARDNIQTMFKQRNNPLNYVTTNIIPVINIKAPAPRMQTKNDYIPTQVTRLNGGPTQITGPTTLKDNVVNHPQINDALKINNSAMLHGSWNGMIGESQLNNMIAW